MDSWFRHEELQTTLLDVNYAYDANGLRISKKAGTVEHKYFYDGGNLVSEVVGSTYLRFGYDEKGLLSTLTYNNGTTSSRYFYVRDILLNIIGLKDVLGYLVVRYNYDAWGKILSVSGSEASTVGQANPFRYKGYYYDFETMMYYCQSRYYVPEWCRWLNADNPGYLNFDSPKGVNLFAYCGNNPVMLIDSTGHSPEFWLHLLSGLMIIGGIAMMFVPGGQVLGLGLIGAGVGSFIGGNISEMNGGSFSSGWLIGGLVGFGFGIGFGYSLPYIGSFLGSTAFNIGVPSLTMTTVGTLAWTTTTVAVSWGSISTVLAGVTVMAMSYGADRYKRTVGSNQAANEFIDHLQQKYGFDDSLRERLHREISQRGFSKKIIEEILKRLLRL